MKQRKIWYFLMTFILIFALMPIQPAFIKAEAKNTFTDVAKSHWAYQHIIKMELRGIVTGYTDNTFRPEKAVTQLEAVIMAIRQMGLQNQIDYVDISSIDNDALGLPKGWNAERYVALALEKNIIELERFEPTTAASRAWIAQMIVRIIGGEEEVVDNTATDFFDDLQIPTWAKGYVSLAVEKNIVTGSYDAQGRKVFNPHDQVTRAQLATMISRSDKYMRESENVLSGMVEGVNGQYISIKANNNEVRTYLISNQLNVFNEEGKKSAIEELVKGDSILFEKDKLNYIAYIEKLEPTSLQTNLSGTVVQLFEEDQMITIKGEDGKFTIYKYVKEIDTSQITVGGSLQFVIDGNKVIKSIKLNSEYLPLMGNIYSLDLDSNILVLENASQYQAYTLADQVIVEYQGIRFPNVKDLQKGDQVELKVNESNQIETIKMIQPYQISEMNGKIAVISEDKKIITVRFDDSSLKAFDIVNELEINIKGISQPSLEDLLVGDVISFTTEKGKITELSVNNRSYTSEIKGVVKSIDTVNGYLTIENAQEELVTFPIDSYVTLNLDINDPELIDVKVGDKVFLTIENNKVYSITLDNTLEGKLVLVDDRNERIVLQTELEGKKTFPLHPNVDVDIINVRYPDIDDLEVGNELVLIFDQDLVVDIRVKKEWTTDIVEVNTTRNRITVKNDTSEKTYEIHSDIKLVVPNVKNPKLEDINEGDIVKLAFIGNELTNVTIIPPIYGYITAINAYQNRLYYRADDIENVITTSDATFYNNQNNEISLQQLTTGDYIKLLKMDDKAIITKAEKVEGTLTTINIDNGKIYIQDINKRYQFYSLAKDVEVFNGTTRYHLGDIQENQSISIYIVDDKVVAIKINN